MAQPYHLPIAPKPQIFPGTGFNSAISSQFPVAPAPRKNSGNRRSKAAVPHTDAEWEALKPEVTDMVNNQKLKPLEIEKHFDKKDPPFVANKRQWERRLTQWGLRTNIPSHKKAKMIKVKNMRWEREGKDTEFRYMKRDVPMHKLDRYTKTNQPEDIEYGSIPTPSTISDVTVFTPRNMDTPRYPDTPRELQTPTNSYQIPAPSSGTELVPFQSQSYSPGLSSFAAPSPALSTISIRTDYTFEGQSPAPIRLATPVPVVFQDQWSIASNINPVPTEILDWPQRTSNFDSTNFQAQASINNTEDTDLINMPPPTHAGTKPQARYLQDEEDQLRIDLERAEQEFGKDHINTWPIMHKLCNILLAQGRFKSAEVFVRRILHASSALDRDGPNLLRATVQLGIVLAEQGRYDKAERVLRPVIRKLEHSNKSHHEEMALYQASGSLAWVFCELNNFDECFPLHEKRVKLGVKLFGVGSLENYEDRGDLAMTILDYGEVDAALAEMRDVLEGLYACGEKRSYVTLRLTTYLCAALQSKGYLMEALEKSIENKALAQSVFGAEHPLTLRCNYIEGTIYLDQGKKIDGRRILEKVLEIEERVQGKNHPYTNLTRDALEMARN